MATERMVVPPRNIDSPKPMLSSKSKNRAKIPREPFSLSMDSTFSVGHSRLVGVMCQLDTRSKIIPYRKIGGQAAPTNANLPLTRRLAYALKTAAHKKQPNRDNSQRTDYADDNNCSRHVPVLSDPADDKTAKGSHALQGPEVNAENTPTQFVGNGNLNQCVH